MPTVIPVKFQYAARDLWFDPAETGAQEADHVICATERGTEIGLATGDPREISEEALGETIGHAALKSVVRIATEADLNHAELLARKEIQIENYEKLIDIEAKTCLNMLDTIYMPAIAEQMTQICNTVAAIQASGISAGLKAATGKAEAVGTLYDLLPDRIAVLAAAIEEGNPAHMRAAMVAAREVVDKLETMVDADLWPVPTYAEMLNIHSK